MPDRLTEGAEESVENTGFLEEAEQNFKWKDIPLEGWICLPIFWILAIVVFWQFFTRYVLNDSAVWTEEVARQFLILLTFYGAGYALRTRAHICIAYFVEKLTGKIRTAFDSLSFVIEVLFYGYSCLLCLDIAKATQFQKLMAVDISKSVVYQGVALSFAIMTIRSGIDIWRSLHAQRMAKRKPSSI